MKNIAVDVDLYEAMIYLYDLEKKVISSRDKEIIDYALDELLKNPNPCIRMNCKNRARIIASYAIKTAKSKLKRRDKHRKYCFENDIVESKEFVNELVTNNEYDYRKIEIDDFIEKEINNDTYKDVINLLKNDLSVDDIAQKRNISKNNANVLIYRARNNAKRRFRV